MRKIKNGKMKIKKIKKSITKNRQKIKKTKTNFQKKKLKNAKKRKTTEKKREGVGGRVWVWEGSYSLPSPQPQTGFGFGEEKGMYSLPQTSNKFGVWFGFFHPSHSPPGVRFFCFCHFLFLSFLGGVVFFFLAGRGGFPPLSQTQTRRRHPLTWCVIDPRTHSKIRIVQIKNAATKFEFESAYHFQKPVKSFEFIFGRIVTTQTYCFAFFPCFIDHL